MDKVVGERPGKAVAFLTAMLSQRFFLFYWLSPIGARHVRAPSKTPGWLTLLDCGGEKCYHIYYESKTPEDIAGRLCHANQGEYQIRGH